MPDIDPYDAIVSAASGSQQRVKPTTSHLNELTKFAQENKLTVGSSTGGRHNTGSLHYTGNAIDIKGSGAFDDDTVRRLSDAAKSQGLLVRDERVRPVRQKVWGGPHIHIEYAGQNGQQLKSPDPYDAIVNAASGEKQSSPYDSVVQSSQPQKPARKTGSWFDNKFKQGKPVRRGSFTDVQGGIEAIRPNLMGEGAAKGEVPNADRVRQVVSAAAPPGFGLLPRDAQEAIGEQVAKGATGIMKLASGAIKVAPRIPTLGIPNPIVENMIAPVTRPAQQLLNKAADMTTSGAQQMEKQANRPTVHVPVLGDVGMQDVYNVGGGAIASAPALGLMRLGVPAPVAFGLQSYLEAEGRDAELKDVLKETGVGAATGALFEIPLPARMALLAKIGAKLGIVGGGTYGIEKLTGMPEAEARKNAAVNALFAASGVKSERPEIKAPIQTVPDTLQGQLRGGEIDRTLASREASVKPPTQASEVPAMRVAGRLRGAQPIELPQAEYPETKYPESLGVVGPTKPVVGVEEGAKLNRWQHRNFGLVTETADQSNVTKGRVRVVDEKGNEHIIQRSNGRGEGNNIAVPVKSDARAEDEAAQAAENAPFKVIDKRTALREGVNANSELPQPVTVRPESVRADINEPKPLSPETPSAAVRHVDLQPRVQRGEGKGQFKEETAAQRESRLAQVNPTEPQALGGAIPKDANLTEASQNGSTIYFEFDAMRPMPTAEQMNAALSTEGAQASVVRYDSNIVSGARGTVRFRADIRDADGRMSSKAAERVYEKVFGTKDRISGDTTLAGILTPEEQFKLGVDVSKAQDLGTPISDPRIQPRQAQVSPAEIPAEPSVSTPTEPQIVEATGDLFIRKPTTIESRGGVARARGFNSIPPKKGYEVTYKPYGNSGDKADAGYYYSLAKPEGAEPQGATSKLLTAKEQDDLTWAKGVIAAADIGNPNAEASRAQAERIIAAKAAQAPESREASTPPVASAPKSSESTSERKTVTRIQPKGINDAIQEQIPSEVGLRQQAGDGKALGEGNAVDKVAPKTETPSRPETYRAGDKERSFPKTLAESGRESGTNLTYDVITNPESRARAKSTVESKGIDGAMGDLRSSEGAHRTALGIELIDRATQAANEAEAKGDLPESARRREQAIEAANVASENLTKAGQEVQAAQIANRYTPEGAMLESARIAKSTNVPLKIEDAQKTSQYAQRVADAEKRISDLEKIVSDLKTGKVAPKGTLKTKPSTKIQTAKDYFAQLESDAKARLEARKKISVKGSEAGASTIPLDIADWTIIGASKIARGGLTYAEWQSEMIKDLGEQVRPHLERIFLDANKQVKEKRTAVSEEMKSRAAQKKQKPGQSLEDALEELNGERARARQAKRDLDRHFRELELDAQKGKMDAFLSLTRDSLLSLRGLGRILSGMTGKQAIDLAGKIPATASDVVLSKALGTPRTTTLPSFGTLLRTVGGFAGRVGPAAKSAFKGEATAMMPEAYPQPKSESPLITYSARIMQKLYGTKESVIRSWAYPRAMEEQARTFAVNDASEGLIKRSQVDQRAKDYVRGRVEFDGKENQRLAQSLAEQAAKYEVQSKQIIPSMEKVRVKDMVKSPTELLHSLALQNADKAVYAQPSTVSKGIGAARSAITSIAPEAKTPLEIAQTTVLPFVKRPANNIADNLLGYTGVKIPIEGYRLIKDAINKEFKPSQVKAFNEAVGKGSAGFAVMAVGAALNKSGVLTSPLDKDHPASIKIGDKYYSIGYVPVVGWLLGMGAAYQQNGAKAVPISMAKMVLEHPLLRSAKDISEGLTNLAQAKASGSNWLESAESGASKYAGQTAARVIPAPVKIAAEASDTKERDTRGLTGPLRAGIPGLRQTLPEVGEKPRTSVINPFYSRTTAKQAEWDKKTPAEKLARTQWRRVMNEEDLRTEDEIARDKHLSELRNQARNPDNKTKVQSELQQMLSRGEISKKHGEAILNVGSNQLLEDLKSASLPEALNVYDVASPKERQDLIGVILRKRHLLNEMSGMDRTATENRLKKLGIPLTGQVPPREVPKKMFLQNVPQRLGPVVQSAP